MLDELRVSNLGLIEEAHVDLDRGFVVVTGETGAGKTLLLGALRLLGGADASRDHIGPAAAETTVEGRFVFEGGEIVARRQIVRGGKNRAYLDGSMAPVAALSEAVAGRIEIVGQHDQLDLVRPAGIRRLVDAALDAEGRVAAADFAGAWDRLQGLLTDREALGGDGKALQRELDVVRFQVDEITAAGFAPGDDRALAAEADRLRNAQSILEDLAIAVGALDGEEGGTAADAAGVAVDALRRAGRHDDELGPVLADLEGAMAVIAESTAALRRRVELFEHDPGRLAEVEERLAVLADLRRKYGDSLDEILAFAAAAEARAAELTRLLDRAAGLDDEVDKARLLAAEHADRLTGARRAAADRIAAEAVVHLTELGMATPVVRFVVEPDRLGPAGADRIRLEFASSEGLTPGPVAKVASGGELSRLVLALRLAAGAADVPVIAFDEVDTGVGGATALAMGRMLAALARGRQVLAVTHLPQVAAFADRHLVVERTGDTAAVRVLDEAERVRELTRMLAGMPESDTGRDHAIELLEAARSAR